MHGLKNGLLSKGQHSFILLSSLFLKHQIFSTATQIIQYLKLVLAVELIIFLPRPI